jgi:hypothetical protein
MFVQYLQSGKIELEEVGARGISALAVTPHNKVALVKVGAAQSLVALLLRFLVQHRLLQLSKEEEAAEAQQVAAAGCESQTTQRRRRHICQMGEVLRLLLKSVLSLSDVNCMQTYICAKALNPLLDVIADNAVALGMRSLAAKILTNLARQKKNQNRLYKAALARTVLAARDFKAQAWHHQQRRQEARDQALHNNRVSTQDYPFAYVCLGARKLVCVVAYD